MTMKPEAATPKQPLVKVEEIASKGFGVVARVNIPKGTQILVEKPILTVSSMDPDKLEPILASKLKNLPKEQQQQFLSLHNNFRGKTPFSGIVKTNALPCGSGASIGAVYPTICRVNHSCLPNAHNNWDEERGEETIYATRDIPANEEITIRYDRGGGKDDRQAFLRNSFGFECSCQLCSAGPTEVEASDERQKLITILDDAVGNPTAMMRAPASSLQKCRKLQAILQEEYQDSAASLLARANYDAFQICVVHGDAARASVFTGRAWAHRVVCEGENSPSTKRMKYLERDPKSHISFETISTQWKNRTTTVPKNLKDDELESWLWRRAES